MSEQTPDTESGMADGQDPSMEDILASIRKIIAEDDIQPPVVDEASIAEVVTEPQTLGGDVAQLGQVETLDLDIVSDESSTIDPDIDALIGDMDAKASDNLSPQIAPVEQFASESVEDVLDLEIPMDDTALLSDIEVPEVSAEIDLVETEALTLEDELIDLVGEDEDDVIAPALEEKPKIDFVDGALAAMGLAGATAVVTADEASSEVEDIQDDDLSLMLDNMLEDSASYQEESADIVQDQVIDPAADLIAEDVGDDILGELDFIEDTPEVISESDPDIDLVKSLMADLTEEPLHEEAELLEEQVETLLSEDDDQPDASTDDIMDEILSVTIDDETKLSEELAIPSLNQPSVEDLPPAESLSLKDIAAAAEADAAQSETGASTEVAAGLAAAALGGVASVTSQDDSEIEIIETESDDVDAALSELENLQAEEDIAAQDTTSETLTPESIIEETPDMARAKKTDAIIDEVTETATAGAFASLTNVVEDKAVRAERGDRIGDLVMEALQPMLKEWLDANLKGIVERAVTKEVKRISSGK